MSLLSTDITKIKKLSLKGVELPAPKKRDIAPIKKVEKPIASPERPQPVILKVEKPKTDWEKLNKENDKTGDRIKTIRGEIKTRERENSELQGEIRALEDSFIQTAKRCKIEWYRPKWMGSKTTNKLNDLKYWTS